MLRSVNWREVLPTAIARHLWRADGEEAGADRQRIAKNLLKPEFAMAVEPRTHTFVNRLDGNRQRALPPKPGDLLTLLACQREGFFHGDGGGFACLFVVHLV